MISDVRPAKEQGMEPATLEALRGSIAKWEAIVHANGEDNGPDNCPLCQLFNNMVNSNARLGCLGCPVAEKTGRPGCCGTPYMDYDDAMTDGLEDEAAQAAIEELEFLKSLLPLEAA